MAVISGSKSRSSRWHQRAVALASSLPIRPRPMMPNRILRRARGMTGLQITGGFLRRRAVVNDSHERARHTGGVGVLDHVASVDNTLRPLLHNRVGALQDFLI